MLNNIQQKNSSSKSLTQVGQLLSGVYFWMSVGVLISGVLGAVLFYTGIIHSMFSVLGSAFMWLVLGGQIIIAMVFQSMTNKLNHSKALTTFLVYSAFTGLTIGVVLAIYTAASIVGVFLIAAMGYGALAIFGMTTKKDLGPIGTFCYMGMFMLFGFMIFHWLAVTFGWFAGMQESMNLVIGIVGTLIFSGLTAYESQKLKHDATSLTHGNASAAAKQTFIVSGAFIMYLNFINLFISLLRIFGDRR